MQWHLVIGAALSGETEPRAVVDVQVKDWHKLTVDEVIERHVRPALCQLKARSDSIRFPESFHVEP